MDYILKFNNAILNIVDSFTGELNNSTEEVTKMRKEVFDISIIPNPGDDKKRLKGDFNRVLLDTKKAQRKLREEILEEK
ncbi:hypothetical protein SAMN05216480_10554 [Pustulibacterium marinum]|uniref:Uncharacterized protein n=1 Tax=Pustulibacterium marinum TaxID=1224947 RepID=A0A1I7GL95_9FLAO|nr:hypothetical protein [Pustulibacterium marinum]SFU49223.1 hypothetical protein SAMN05216480_10554 [Pustulibacterium marinum]